MIKTVIFQSVPAYGELETLIQEGDSLEETMSVLLGHKEILNCFVDKKQYTRKILLRKI